MSFAYQTIPNVFIDGYSPKSKPTFSAWSASGIVLRTSVELDNHYLAYIPADCQIFDNSWYNLTPVFSSVTESIVSFMYVGSNTALDSIYVFFGMFPGDKLCAKWWWIDAKYHPVELEHIWFWGRV